MRRVPSTPVLLGCLVFASLPAVAAGGAGGHSALSLPALSTLEKATEGEVTELAAGLHLTLRIDDGKKVTFRLDEKGLETKIAPEVAVGVRVRVVESRLPDGKRSISVTVLAAPGGRP